MKSTNVLLKNASYFKTLVSALLNQGKKEFYSRKLDLFFSLDLKCFVDFIIYYNGAFQREIIGAIKVLIAKYDIELFVDIGSHIGQMSLFVGKHFPGVEIISIDPSPTTRKRHQVNQSLNQLDYDLFSYGLSDHEGQSHLYQPTKTYFKEYFKFNDGRFSLLPAADTKIDDSTLVEMTTLDKVISEKQRSKRVLIKMDVEGFELEVIRGGSEVLMNSKVILILELAIMVQPEKCKKVIDLLLQYGYKMYNLELQEIQYFELCENIDVIFMN